SGINFGQLILWDISNQFDVDPHILNCFDNLSLVGAISDHYALYPLRFILIANPVKRFQKYSPALGFNKIGNKPIYKFTLLFFSFRTKKFGIYSARGINIDLIVIINFKDVTDFIQIVGGGHYYFF